MKFNYVKETISKSKDKELVYNISPCESFPNAEYSCYYNDTRPFLTPTESMYELLAGGMQTDLSNRREYYTEEELEEYKTNEYAVDYIEEYKKILAQKKLFQQQLHEQAKKSKAPLPTDNNNNNEQTDDIPVEKNRQTS